MILYETLFIIKPDPTEDQVQEVIDRITARIERVGGKPAVIDHWGNRELAYPIRYRGERLYRGYYVLAKYAGDGATVEEVERNIKIMDMTFRYLTVKQEDNFDADSVGEVEIIKRERKSRPRPESDAPSRDEGKAEDKPADAPAAADAADDAKPDAEAASEPETSESPAAASGEDKTGEASSDDAPADDTPAGDSLAGDSPADDAPAAADSDKSAGDAEGEKEE